MTSKNRKSPIRVRPQQGISLTEVLVTVVIITLGLLGIAVLQFTSKRSNFEAIERTIATHLANSMLERMRANPGALRTYAGDAQNPKPALGHDSTVFAGGEPTPGCDSSSPCTKDQFAIHDLWDWEQKLLGATEKADGVDTGGLVDPIACLTTTVGAAPVDRSGRYTVAIAWRGTAELSDPVNSIAPTPAYDPYACGRSSGALGTGPYDSPTQKNAHRRILIVDAYIAQ